LQPSGKPVEINVKPILDRIGQLAYADGERYVAQDDGNVNARSLGTLWARSGHEIVSVLASGDLLAS
jgi:hypothetical protein